MAKVHIDLLPEVPRGKHIGKPVGAPPTNEADHFIQCPVCTEWIDMRDLGQVIEHEDKDCARQGVTAQKPEN